MMDARPKISIILPVKDGDAVLLQRAVSSVLAQTFSEFELLLIDDGSRPEYAAELDRIGGSDPRIRVFHIPNGGVSAARNFAIGKAEGEIVTFLDSDDAICPCCFEEAFLLLTDPGIDALFGGTCFADAKKMQALSDNRAENVHTRRELLDRCVDLTPARIHETRSECIGEPFRFDGDSYINRGIAARFIRRKILQDATFSFPPGYKMYEDTLWNMEMINRLHILYVKSLWYYYYDNPVSASNRLHTDIISVMETPIQRITELLDLTDPVEYRAYTRFLMDSLRYIYNCLYGHKDWHPQKGERAGLRRHIYQEEPWTQIASSRFYASASGRDRQKALLYRMHLLLLYWKLT